MSDVDAPRRSSGIVLLLGLLALAGLAASLVAEPGTRAQALTAAVTSGVAALVAAAVIRGAGRSWPAGAGAAGAFVLVGVATTAFLIAGILDPDTYQPRAGDLAFLLVLVPLGAALRRELRTHFDAPDRREITIDAWLLGASIAVLLYLVIRPLHAGQAISMSAATFAILAAAILTAFGALTLWAPTISHLLQFVAFSGYAVAITRFGWEWTRGDYPGNSTWMHVLFVLSPLALAAAVTLVAHADAGSTHRRAPLARPVLTSAGVITACGTLAFVAIIDDARGIAGGHSTILVAFLGASVVARVIASQVASSVAHDAVRDALARREIALREADTALERVREANETLRGSEEHLRLVFDAAVDGFVELDARGVVVRANDAFGRMVRLDRQAIEGQPWHALAASIEGADPSFASLPETGNALIQRTEGQPLYLESRVSEVPTSPPRRLLLVRDVTSAKVADQTIRSLFHFLQDRDEDRTRLLRRTNAAIESERNRIARDLHDGPVQGVSAASLSLEAALLMIKAGDADRGIDVLAKIRAELAGEADALRRLMAGLRPPVLEERGLIPALRDTLVRFGAEHEVQTTFSGTITDAVPNDLETLAYRVVQEALANAGKHALATHVSVTVDTDEQALRVEVEDNGNGFDSAQSREFLRQGRVGLASMRERVELASGTFTVRSSPGRGTTIVAVLPLDASMATVTVP